MKNLFYGVILCTVAINSFAQTAPSQGATAEAPQDTPFTIVQRDGNANVWQRTTYEQMPSGEWIPHLHTFQETATGLNFRNSDTGQWEASSEQIEIVQGGAVARHGQHKVIFAADLATFGAIDMETPDGQRLQSHMLGLCYFDRASGQSVFIAQVTNSIGQLISSNQVWYDNAFTGVKAGVRYSYTREGFEQDVILEEQPPSPESYGLNSSTTVLQAYTEFISPPAPVVSMNFLSEGEGQQLLDKSLTFSTMKIGRGRAFLAANSAESTPVAKDWATVENRQFLIEQVPIPQIANQLQTLPPAQASVRLSNSVLNVVSSKRLLPGSPLAKAGTNQMKLASVPFRKVGFTSLSTSQTNFTFQGDTTYYISGNVNLFGTNTTFEGGAVIKYTNGVSLTVNTPVDWRAGPYRPVVMSAKDDDACGDSITGSTGSPGTNYYAAKALYFDGTSALTNIIVQNLRVLNANAAVVINGQSNHVITDLQVVNCANGIAVTNTDFSLRNGLFAIVLTNFTGSNAIGRVEHLTSDTAIWLNKDIGTNLFLTNCLLSAVTNLGSCTTQNVAVVASGSGVFQPLGAANYYLAANSPYRDAGTTNINAILLAQLRQKTTYPPVLCSSNVVSANTNLNNQALRDVDTPDLGYHYDPIDYLADNFWITNATVTVSPGTVIASYNDTGMIVTDGSAITSIGTALAPIWYTKYFCAQEQSVKRGSYPATSQIVNSFHSSTAPAGQYRFSKFSSLASGGYLLYDTSQWAYSNLLVQDCEFWNNQTDFSGNNSVIVNLKNNLFARSGATFFTLAATNMTLTVSNNLFWNTFFSLRGATNYSFFNNCFYNTGIAGPVGQTSINGYNAYLVNTNRLLKPTGTTDVVSASPLGYQVGPLGYFYLPSGSSVINTGSISADLTGLYHYTTQTNQVKETNSIVDIGYHYVALDNLGNPVDTDGDGIPDYVEDANGNGVFDAGDSGDWQINQYNGLTRSSGLQVFTPLK